MLLLLLLPKCQLVPFSMQTTSGCPARKRETLRTIALRFSPNSFEGRFLRPAEAESSVVISDTFYFLFFFFFLLPHSLLPHNLCSTYYILHLALLYIFFTDVSTTIKVGGAGNRQMPRLLNALSSSHISPSCNKKKLKTKTFHLIRISSSLNVTTGAFKNTS